MLLLGSWSVAFGADDPECSTSGFVPEGSVFVGYTRPDEPHLRSLGLLVSKKLEPYDGRNLHVGLILHGTASASPVKGVITSVNPYLNLLGVNHCVFPAELSIPVSRSWRFWVSDTALILREPSRAEQDSLRMLIPDCVSQGDHPPGQEQCAHAELLAVSDFNANGLPEYWYTAHYMWDTGIRVAELSAPSRLAPLISACPGCSD